MTTTRRRVGLAAVSLAAAAADLALRECTTLAASARAGLATLRRRALERLGLGKETP